jgi:aryl-phospho-beta-D-glucosidase BglC (GH1 family)
MTFEDVSDQGDFSMKTQKQKPIHEVRLGHIKAAVWKNEVENGVRYNATFSRIYKDGDNWKSTDSFGRDDLLVLAKVADNAHSWIHQQSPGENGANRAASRENDDR